MKLWRLQPQDERPEGNDPWTPWYDKCFGFVIRAPDEDVARRIAATRRPWTEGGSFGEEGPEAWLDPTLSECQELTPDGEPEVLLYQFSSA